MKHGEETAIARHGHVEDARSKSRREVTDAADDRFESSTAVAHSSPWEMRTKAVLSAWGCSLMVHACLFLVMFALVFPYTPMSENRLPVTHAALVGEVLPMEATSTTMSLWSATDASQSTLLDPAPRVQQFTPRASDTLTDRPLPIGGRKSPDSDDLAIVGMEGTGIAAAGSDFNETGWSMGGGGRADFFGLGRTVSGVQRVVYVVDRSGSMTDSFDFVREELKRSVGALKRSQKFHVLFFSSGEPVENPPKTLVSAIAAQKEQFFQFLSGVMPGGSTHPEPAMKRALDLEPDLVYFLTDGEFEKSLLGKLEEWNKDRRTKICTVAFFGADGAGLLEQIAREHGGEFRFVSEHDLP